MTKPWLYTLQYTLIQLYSFYMIPGSLLFYKILYFSGTGTLFVLPILLLHLSQALKLPLSFHVPNSNYQGSLEGITTLDFHKSLLLGSPNAAAA